MFDEGLLLRMGLEYSATLKCGHVVRYLSRKTADLYRIERSAIIKGPEFGPYIPICGDTGNRLWYNGPERDCNL